LIEIRASFETQEEKAKLLRMLEQQGHLKVKSWPRKEYQGKGKSPRKRIYLELSAGE